MTTRFDRRRLIKGTAMLGTLNALALGGCATSPGSTKSSATISPFYDPRRNLAPVRARADRLFDITVCLRPFRAAGPRLETEQVGDKLVVHNYGHGGSGWSLSWGSSSLAVQKAFAASPSEVAVVGCGALGLTSALLAQRAGAQTTIYARELLPQTRSSRATGTWTPDSRIALTSVAGPAFATLWEQMARTSFKTYRSYLGLPGDPVQWIDYYLLKDSPSEPGGGEHRKRPGQLDFADYYPLIRDLTPRPELEPPGSTPFPTPIVERSSTMMFNIADYGHTLMSDFLAAGGRIERAEFHAPSDLARLKQKVVINCPGYGARALWKDESIVPVRGQIGWLIPQPELTYGLYYRDVSIVPRRDGIVVQALDGGDMKGYGVDNEAPDRGESEAAVAVIADLYSRFGDAPRG
jgi:glycine/D-amino acid oxidase-like deaminating enzyme